MELTEVTISNNASQANIGGNEGGGGILHRAGTMKVSGGTIGSNQARLNGGGIYLSEGTLELSEVVIHGNETNGSGGGIYTTRSSGTDGSHLEISGGIISHNKSVDGSGGGFYGGGRVLELSHVTIAENSSAGGGGISISYQAQGAKLTDVNIIGNSAWNGGGLSISNSNPILTNVLIRDNVAENTVLPFLGSSGGGIFIEGESNPEFRNVLITGNNTVGGRGGGIHDSGNGTATFLNATIADNYAENGGGNIDADPLFSSRGTEGDYQLQEASPAIDKGNNDYVPDDVLTDLLGVARIVNDIVDLGAYEHASDTEAPVWPGDAQLTVEPNEEDSTRITLAWPAATDNVAVTTYSLHQDEMLLAQFTSDHLAELYDEDEEVYRFTVDNLTESREYSFALIAEDALGNRSASLIAIYHPGEGGLEPPEPGTFQVHWNIARSAYPYLLARQDQPLQITVIGDPEHVAEATIHYESWFSVEGDVLTEPRELEATVILVEDAEHAGRYVAEIALTDLERVGKLLGIEVLLSQGSKRTTVSREIDLTVASALEIDVAQDGSNFELTGSRLKIWSEEGAIGSNLGVSGPGKYLISDLVPGKEYTVTLLQARTNQPLIELAGINLRPGERLARELISPAPAWLEVNIDGMDITSLSLGVRLSVRDASNGTLLGSSTVSTLTDHRPASGVMLVSGQQLSLELTGLEFPYVSKTEKQFTLGSGLNEVNMTVELAEKSTITGIVTHSNGGVLEGIQVTSIQEHPLYQHRSIVRKTLTDDQGQFTLEVLPGTATLQVADPVEGTIVPVKQHITGLILDGSKDMEFEVVSATQPASLYVTITTKYMESEEVQVWEPEQIDWRTVSHFRINAYDLTGKKIRTGSYQPFKITGGLGQVINVCVDGREASMPNSCAETTIEFIEGKLQAFAHIDLVQTGAIVEGIVSDVSGNEINNWSGSLYKLENGKRIVVNIPQHGIQNRSRYNQLAPQQYASRAEAATMLKRFIDLVWSRLLRVPTE